MEGSCIHEPACPEGPCCPDGGGGKHCCPDGASCCGSGCCAAGTACCLDATVLCCEVATEACCPDANACCASGYTCCDDVCCPEPCEDCIDNGQLTGGTITVEPEVVCIGDTITFTIDGVVDSGGMQRVQCTEEEVPPVTPTYTWDLTIPPDYPPPLPPLSGSGPAASVVAEVEGNYSVTFTASADRDCPPEDVTLSASKDTCAAATAVAGQGQTCGIDVTIKDISFGDDHPMFEEAAPCDVGGACWGAGAGLSTPDWASENNPDNPVCYTRSTAMRLTVKIEVTGSGGGTATLRVTGPDGVVGEGTFAVPCGTEDLFVSITTSALPAVVKAYTPASLSWSVQPPGDPVFYPLGSTSHRIYVTLATPGGSAPTNRRMNFVCTAAAQAATALEAIDGAPFGGGGIHARLAGNPPVDGCPAGTTCVDDWRLMAGWVSATERYNGECDEQAHLMNLAIQLLGAGAGAQYKTYASTDAQVTTIETTSAQALGVTQDLDGDGQMGDETLELIFDFDPPPNPPPPGWEPDWNLFEGSISAAGRYYAVWPSFAADSELGLFCKVLQGVAAEQQWVYRIVNPDDTWYVVYAHPGAVPPPACPP